MYSKILCFDENTSVKVLKGYVLIKDIVPGTEIVSYDSLNKVLCIDKIKAIAKSLHDICAVLLFENGTSIRCTIDHPLFVEGKGWCAVNVNYNDEMYGVKVSQLNEGDFCLLLRENEVLLTKLISINRVECSESFYCITTENFHTFFANNILAHDVNIDKFKQETLLNEGVIVSGL